MNKLGAVLKTRREALGFTQRSLAGKLGVEASHVAFIESGRRKPSLKLIARIADILGIDRQEVLVLAHPEARALLTANKPEPPKHTNPSWQRFIRDHTLLTRYHVTKRELQDLEQISLLGTAMSAKEFLAILTLIRNIPEPSSARRFPRGNRNASQAQLAEAADNNIGSSRSRSFH